MWTGIDEQHRAATGECREPLLVLLSVVLNMQVTSMCRVGGEVSKSLYSHHQKSVILDSDDGAGARRVVAFIGGLDLADGRFDTPEFPLFDYATSHAKDFYQACTPGATADTGENYPFRCRVTREP